MQIRVLVLTSSYPRFPNDTASVFLQYLCSELAQQGIEVHVLAPASDRADETIGNNIHVHRFRYLPRPFRKLAYGSGILPNLRRHPLLWLTVPLFLCSMYFSLVSLKRRIRPTIVHCHWVIPQGLVAVLANLVYPTPIVVSAHGGDAFSLKSPLLKYLKHLVLKHATVWTANTKTTASAISDNQFFDKLKVIPMGVDAGAFAAGDGDRLRENLPAGTRIILFVGRLVEKKGVDTLIEAFSRVPDKEGGRLLLWIIGEGKQESALRSLAADMGLEKRVIFWGSRPNTELPDYYAAADLFVGPSVVDSTGDTEGQGVVFLEAFACGTPVIASNVGGIPDIVDHDRNGYLVPPNDAEALAEAINTLLGDEKQRSRLAQAAKQTVEEEFDWKTISARFVDTYGELLPRKR